MRSRLTAKLNVRVRPRISRFSGVLHVDGYAGFEPLAEKGDVVLATCRSHTRRKFYDVAQATNAPIAVEALRRIGELYAVEADAHGQSPAQRLAARRSRSKPIVEALSAWLEAQLPLLSGRSTLAESIRYALARWQGLTRFLHDCRIPDRTRVALRTRHVQHRQRKQLPRLQHQPNVANSHGRRSRPAGNARLASVSIAAAHTMIVVAGVQLPRERDGFVLLASQDEPSGSGDQASAADFLDAFYSP